MSLMSGVKPTHVANHLSRTIETLYSGYASWVDNADDQADILEMERHYRDIDKSKEIPITVLLWRGAIIKCAQGVPNERFDEEKHSKLLFYIGVIWCARQESNL